MTHKRKINLYEYLKWLNTRLERANVLLSLRNRSFDIVPWTCSDLAREVGVTPATLSNLNTDSKFSLIDSIADELLFHYCDLYRYIDQQALTDWEADQGELDERPERHNTGRVIWELTHVYSDKVR